MNLSCRTEQPADRATIHAVHEAAFGRPAEADLVDALRSSEAFIPELSIVATLARQLVGHILLSRILIEQPHHADAALALAPLSVHPDHQSRGIGSSLIRHALDHARVLNHTRIIVLGEPAYYKRFGFRPAAHYSIAPPFEVPEQAFMALGLMPDAFDNIAGTVRYPVPFMNVDE